MIDYDLFQAYFFCITHSSRDYPTLTNGVGNLDFSSPSPSSIKRNATTRHYFQTDLRFRYTIVRHCLLLQPRLFSRKTALRNILGNKKKHRKYPGAGINLILETQLLRPGLIPTRLGKNGKNVGNPNQNPRKLQNKNRK